MARFRGLKQHVETLLRAEDWRERLAELEQESAKSLLGPLFSFLIHGDELRWRAVTAFGPTVSRLAGDSMEEARVVMRRFMWNLNEESGSLGWGSPEAMGEVLACHDKLADEFHKVLVSYIHDTGKASNYIDHAPLRLGGFWGVGRLCHARPLLMDHAVEPLLAGLVDDENPAIPGMAAWALAPLRAEQAKGALTQLLDRDEQVDLFRDGVLETVAVGDLARETLSALDAPIE